MKILVTGANGYIGSKVVKKLLDMNQEVVAVDFDNNHLDNRAIFYNENIFDDKDYYLIFGKPDICLHMAWRDGFIHNSTKHMEDLSYHFKFLKHLIDSGIKQIAIMGSMHEVGYWEGEIGENTPTNPQSLYGVSKNSLRKSIELIAKDKNVLFQWLRGFYIFGDDEYGNSIFCKIKQSVRDGKETFPFTSGRNKFDFIEINELAHQISCVVTQNVITGIINVCSGKPVALGDQIEWYIKENNLPIKLDYGKFPDRPFESPCIFGNTNKINTILSIKQKKILVTGFKGQLGYDLVKELKERGYINVKGIDIEDLDITDEMAVHKYIDEYNPEVIMHNAAYTAVDKAEDNMEMCRKVNAYGTKYLAEAAEKVNAKIIYISTDYVFDGTKDGFYETTDLKNPLSVYGLTKSEGENFVLEATKKYFIVRISWFFGINGNNFIKTMLRLGETKSEINVVFDQVGSPTYSCDLAKLLCDMIETDKYGIYHATNEGVCSWYEFACEIFKESATQIKVNPIPTAEYLTKATRPLNSKMSKQTLIDNGFKLLPSWKDALKRYIKELK